MKKKMLSAILVGMLTIISLVACGKQPAAAPATEQAATEQAAATEKETTATAATDSGKQVTLTMGIWDVNQEPGMKAMTEKFMEENPNIKVEVQVTPWDEYWTKMEAAATGGAMPDVFWMHTNEFIKYASNDMLMPLDEVIGDGFQNFPEGLTSLSMYGGVHYGVPKDFDTIALLYNKELFDKAGIAYPDDTWTWDTMLEAAKKITDQSNGIYGFLAPLEDQVGYLPWIYQAGGTVIDGKKSGINSAEAIRGLQFYTDLILKEKVSPTLAQMTDTHYVSIFQSGKAGMCLVGSWQLGAYAANEDIKDKFDMAVLPQDKQRATMINGLSFAGSTKTEHPEEVKLLLKYLASEPAQTLQAELGTAISAYNGTGEKWIQTYPQYNSKIFLDMKEYAYPVPTSNTKSKWGEVVTEMVKKMLMGEIDVKGGTLVIAEEMDKLLATE